MSGAIPPLPNTPSWRGDQLKKSQGQLYFIRYAASNGKKTLNHELDVCGRKWPVINYYPSIFLKGPRKTTKTNGQDRRPRIEPGTVTTCRGFPRYAI
jgi:hypothetical protein